MSLRTSKQIYNLARSLYSDNLHYHNFQHVIDTLSVAERIIRQCEDKQIHYDKKVICHAILFHDAGYEANHISKGYKNKETYSAKLASDILADAGEQEVHIEAVKNAILCTQINAVCHSNNDNIVRAADLSALVLPYSEFKQKSIDLYKERELMTGITISWDQYKKEAFNIIKGFLQFRINLNIELFAQDNYMFQTKVFYNLNKLMTDSID